MAAIHDVSHSDLLPLKAALNGWGAAARVRLWPGGAATPARPMLWPCPLPELAEAHAIPREAAPADLHVVRNVVVGGPASMGIKHGAYLHAEAAYPGYVRAYIEQDVAPQTWAMPPRGLKTWWIRRAYVLLHHNLMWGHWLTEVFPKLFAIRALREMGVEAPILLPNTAPTYAASIIEDVLPGQPLIFYDETTHRIRVGRLLLPPMLQSFYVFHPALGEALDAYVAGASPAPDAQRLFVSRSGMRSPYAYRELVNEEEIEAVAVEAGFRVVRPETLPWRDQVALFAGARVVAGEFGSGLHNTLLSPAGTKVVALNCIGDIQSRIANFRRQDIGYLLADDGQPRVFHGGAQLQRFRVDPGAFRGALTTAVAAAEESA